MAHKYCWLLGALVLLSLGGACSRSKQGPGAVPGAAGASSPLPNDGGVGGASGANAGASSDDPDEAVGGAPDPSGGAGPQKGGAAGAEADFVDPVAASQADKSGLGTDANGNGVRDDLDDYLKSLVPAASEQVLLTSLAREETKLLLLGEDAQSSASSVREQALRSMSVHHCVVDALGAERARVALTELQSALLNNQLRWTAWLAAEHKLGGSILPSMICDSGLVQP
jgi:hypothetical protein